MHNNCFRVQARVVCVDLLTHITSECIRQVKCAVLNKIGLRKCLTCLQHCSDYQSDFPGKQPEGRKYLQDQKRQNNAFF